MTPDERLRRRLEALNRGPLPAASLSDSAHSRVATRPRDGEASAHAATATNRPQPAMGPGVVQPIPGLLRQGEVVSNDAGEHLQILLTVDQLWPRGERLVAARHRQLVASLRDGESSARDDVASKSDEQVRAFLDAFPEHAVLLDLETCGLAGSALFLIGLLRAINGRLTVELLLARDYAEERAVLTSLWRRIEPANVLVTFNGKSFDWPMVQDRTARHLLYRGGSPPKPRHVDLLHPARRRWKGRLPDCKLQTIENHICGRRRHGDIPGARIPSAYQEFVRTGFTRDLDAILLHNAVDLVTLLDIAMRLAGP